MDGQRPSHDAQQNSQTPSRVKRILSVALVPVLTVAAVSIGWLWMPKPSIPADIDAADVLPKKPVETISSTGHSQYSKQTANKAEHTTSAAAPTKTAAPASNLPTLPTGSKTLVSLGDSITFGFNLPGSTAVKPSPFAYPFLVGRAEHWKVIDLGVTGSESTDLLAALKTQKYQDALKAANIVTVDIGSNDLLHTTYDLLAAVQSQPPSKSDVLSDTHYQQALKQYTDNLPNIIGQIRKYTSAPIVLLNLYDPFPDGSSLHDIGEQVVAAANRVIDETAALEGLPEVDVFHVVNHHQDTYVRLSALDIHPTIEGQQAIADAVVDTVNHPMQHEPVFYAVSSKGTLISSKTSPGPFAVYWLGPNDGLPIVGRSGNWLRVMTPDGTPGYVEEKNVTILLRRFPNVDFEEDNETLATGTIVDNLSQRSTTVFTRDGILYAPVQYLAANANAQVAFDEATREVDVNTPNHSGLIQTGLMNPAPVGGTPASPQTDMSVKMDGQEKTWTVSRQAIDIVVDGEPLHLEGPALLISHQVYVPAVSFWTALGGTVTLDKDGLLKLSATDS